MTYAIFCAQDSEAQLKVLKTKLAAIKVYNPFTKSIATALRLLNQVAFHAVGNQKYSREEIEGTGFFSFFKEKTLNVNEVVIVPRSNNTYTFGVVLKASSNKATVLVALPAFIKEDVPYERLGKILYEQDMSLQAAAAAGKKK
jgi:hypothetical protein